MVRYYNKEAPTWSRYSSFPPLVAGCYRRVSEFNLSLQPVPGWYTPACEAIARVFSGGCVFLDRLGCLFFTLSIGNPVNFILLVILPPSWSRSSCCYRGAFLASEISDCLHCVLSGRVLWLGSIPPFQIIGPWLHGPDVDLLSCPSTPSVSGLWHCISFTFR